MACVPDKLAIHPAAEFFPTLGDAEFEAFKADIAANGLLEPIWLCGDKILDGRNRYRACQELGIAARFRSYTGDSPIAFAWSLNGERRHLSHSQRSAIAVEMLPALHEEAKKRQLAGLKRGTAFPVSAEMQERGKGHSDGAAGEAARIVGASVRSVHYAKLVKERAPALFQKLKAGDVKVYPAYESVRHIPAEPRNQPKEVRVEAIRRLALEGHRGEQIASQLHISPERVSELAHEAHIALPDAIIGRRRKINVARVIEETVSTLEGVALGLRTVDGAAFECAPHEAREWLTSIDASLRVINRVRKYLKECV